MTAKPLSSLQTRILSALVLVPVAIAAAWAGGWIFAVLCVLVGILIGWEWPRLFYKDGKARKLLMIWIGLSAAAAGLAAYFAPYALLLLLGVCFFAALAMVFINGGRVLPAFGVLYAAVPVCAMILFRNDSEYGLWVIIWLFGVVWATDIAAYFTGKALGGPKLSPQYSPNKTWSGLGGGVVAAAIAGGLVAYMIGNSSVAVLAFLSGAMAIIAQIGDVFESSLKRQAGVKDSSHIIPGHGGIMDRLDGLIAVAGISLLIGIARSSESAAKGILIW